MFKVLHICLVLIYSLTLVAQKEPSAKELNYFNIYHEVVLQLEKAESLFEHDLEKAFQIALQVLDSLNEQETPDLVAKANYLVGKYHLVKNESDEALICFLKAENIQRKIKDTIGLNNTLLLKGRVYFNKNELDNALNEFMQTLNNVNSSNNKIVFVDLNELIGKTYFNTNAIDSGIFYYKTIIPELERKNNHKKLGIIYHDLGYQYQKKFDYDNALDCYYKGLESNKIANNNKYLAQCYNKIGYINIRLELFDEAFDSFNNMLNIAIQEKDSNFLARANNNVGLAYKHLNNFDKARYHFEKCLEIGTKSSNMMNVGLANNNLGLLWYSKGEIDKALACFFITLEIYNSKKEYAKVANTCNNISMTYLKANNLQKAKEYAFNSLELINYSSDLYVKKELYELLYEILMALNNRVEAIKYLELFKKTKDKIDVSIHKNFSEDLSLRLYIKHKQKEYLDLIKENEENLAKIDSQGEKIAKQRRSIIIFIVILVLLFICVIYIVKLFISKNRANELLLSRNKTIEEQKKEIEIQKDNLAAINHELEKMSIIAERTNNAVAILDKNGDFIWVNNGFTKMYGFTLTEFKTEIADNIFKANDIETLKDKLDIVREKKIPVTYEFEALCKGGNKIWAQTTLTPILNNKGELQQYIAIDANISDQKKAEQQIIKQNQEIQKQANELMFANSELEKLSIIAERTSNSVILIDDRGAIEWVNKSFTDIYGFTLAEIKGREYKQLVKEYFSLDIKKLVNVWFGTKIPITFDSLNNTKNKGKIWVNTSLTPILDENGNLQKMVVIDSDITPLKKAEQELKRINKDITSSISYAQRIQMASMPKIGFLAEHFSSFLLYFKPREIVSGDFYWFTKHNNKIIVVAADCTGHGVPGAFMSLIGISSLNKIIKEKNITDTSMILYQLRLSIIEALGQRGAVGETSDGMEVSIASFDAEEQTLQVSGAMSQVLLYKNNVLETIKGDRISISYDQLDKSFSSHNFPLSKGDRVYLFTDGVPDQFGGDGKQKLKIKHFREYIQSISEFNLEEQEIKLRSFIKQWQGDNPQIDDNLIIAVEY